MTKDEALKLALEVLEDLQGGCTDSDDGTIEAITVCCPEVITTIKEALAQEQEPVAWELHAGKTDRVLIEITNNPQRAHDWKASLEEVVPLYTTPPQRTWVGLTDEEIKSEAKYFCNGWYLENPERLVLLVKTIQAKLREKNGG